MVYTGLLYAVTAALLGVSLWRDRGKTRQALGVAWRMFCRVLPQFGGILLLVGSLLAALPPAVISRYLGGGSGSAGMLVAAGLGAAAVVPVLVAFPIAAQLLQGGAGVAQIAVFLGTLTTVGLVTLPLEIRYLGVKVALWRNLLALAAAFGSAYILKVIFL